MIDIMIIGARGIPDVEGGAEKHAEKTFPFFAQNGYSVTLLGIAKYVRSAWFQGIQLRRIPTLNFANTDKFVYHFLAFICAVIARPTLVHLQGLNSAIFLSLYKLCGLRVVLRYGSADHLHAKWGFVGRFAFRLCEKQLRFADCVIVVSEKYRRDLQERYNLRRVELVPNGVDAPTVSEEARRFWSSLDLEKNRYVLAVGRITVDKDYDTLVRAVGLLKQSDVKLIVAGGASEADYSERFFAMRDDRIRFIGKVDRRLLSSLYENCGVFVNSSLHEGMSNAILEAISFRCALVVSNIPANTEMGLPKCCYFPKGDPEALAQQIDAALEKPDDFVADHRQFCSWDDVFARTERIYQRVNPAFGPRRRPNVPATDARRSDSLVEPEPRRAGTLVERPRNEH